MKMHTIKAIALCAALLSPSAFAAFDGDYDIAAWTSSAADPSLIDISGAPNSILLTGNDTTNAGGSNDGNTDITANITAAGTITFTWSYTTSDANTTWDPFGYLLNGTFFVLTTPEVNGGGGITQGGTESIIVTLADLTFGFRQNSVDGILGAGSATVSGFSAPSAVPLPPSLGLLAFALGGISLTQRRGSKRSAQRSES